jgi:hypothetical protein
LSLLVASFSWQLVLRRMDSDLLNNASGEHLGTITEVQMVDDSSDWLQL